MWVAHNAGVADPPRDTHIPLRHLNCLAMKDEMKLQVNIRIGLSMRLCMGLSVGLCMALVR